MALNLDFPAKLEQYLLQSAQQKGISIKTRWNYINYILLQAKKIEAAMLLQSWIDDEDMTEQQETGEYLIHALDADRPSGHKLFPPEMKGVTW